MQSHMDSDEKIVGAVINFGGYQKWITFNLFTDPLSTEDFEDNHKAVEEVGEVPSRYLTFWEHTLLRAVVVPVQLHSHHGEDEDDDADDEGEV